MVIFLDGLKQFAKPQWLVLLLMLRAANEEMEDKQACYVTIKKYGIFMPPCPDM